MSYSVVLDRPRVGGQHRALPAAGVGPIVLILALFHSHSLFHSLFHSRFYPAVVSPLAITLLSLGLLWRNAQARSASRVAPRPAPRLFPPEPGRAW
jgi:hypothetical protein